MSHRPCSNRIAKEYPIITSAIVRIINIHLDTGIIIFRAPINCGHTDAYPVIPSHVNQMLSRMVVISIYRDKRYPSFAWWFATTSTWINVNSVILRQVVSIVSNDRMAIVICLVIPYKEYLAALNNRDAGEIIRQPGRNTVGTP